MHILYSNEFAINMFYVNTTVILNWYPLNAYSSEQRWSRANTALLGSDRTKIDTKEKNWYYNSKHRITQKNQTDTLADLNFELTWWRLFQKSVVSTKLDIYVFNRWRSTRGTLVAKWDRSLDLTAHTSLSPIRRGFAPDFVNYKKGALDSQIKFTSLPWSVVLSRYSGFLHH
jgi:hypothetical protein